MEVEPLNQPSMLPINELQIAVKTLGHGEVASVEHSDYQTQNDKIVWTVPLNKAIATIEIQYQT